MTYSLALGPFEQTWRGPQRLVLSVKGDLVADCEYRDGYNGRGCAERLARLSLQGALELVGRVCGTCSHAHRLAFCQAVESLAGMEVPERALALRTLVAELERVASHLGTLRQMMDLLALPAQRTALLRLHEQVRDAMRLVSGAAALPDICVPGGVARDMAESARGELTTLLADVNQRLYHLIDTIIDRRALLARTADVGVLSRDAAEAFGVRGPLARSSGIERDVRIDQPYGFYPRIDCRRVVQEGGDVYARMVVLLLEGFESVKLAEQVVIALPSGPWQGTTLNHTLAGEGSAAVESPRGRLEYTLHTDGRHLTSAQIDAPRQIDRLLARTFLIGAQVDDVPLIMLSLDVCPACSEL